MCRACPHRRTRPDSDSTAVKVSAAFLISKEDCELSSSPEVKFGKNSDMNFFDINVSVVNYIYTFELVAWKC